MPFGFGKSKKKKDANIDVTRRIATDVDPLILVGLHPEAYHRKIWEISEDGATMGSLEANTITLQDDSTSVSRHHARIVYQVDAEVYVVEDLKSANGTSMTTDSSTFRLLPNQPFRVAPGYIIHIGVECQLLVLENKDEKVPAYDTAGNVAGLEDFQRRQLALAQQNGNPAALEATGTFGGAAGGGAGAATTGGAAGGGAAAGGASMAGGGNMMAGGGSMMAGGGNMMAGGGSMMAGGGMMTSAAGGGMMSSNTGMMGNQTQQQYQVYQQQLLQVQQQYQMCYANMQQLQQVQQAQGGLMPQQQQMYQQLYQQSTQYQQLATNLQMQMNMLQQQQQQQATMASMGSMGGGMNMMSTGGGMMGMGMNGTMGGQMGGQMGGTMGGQMGTGMNGMGGTGMGGAGGGNGMGGTGMNGMGGNGGGNGMMDFGQPQEIKFSEVSSEYSATVFDAPQPISIGDAYLDGSSVSTGGGVGGGMCGLEFDNSPQDMVDAELQKVFDELDLHDIGGLPGTPVIGGGLGGGLGDGYGLGSGGNAPASTGSVSKIKAHYHAARPETARISLGDYHTTQRLMVALTQQFGVSPAAVKIMYKEDTGEEFVMRPTTDYEDVLNYATSVHVYPI